MLTLQLVTSRIQISHTRKLPFILAKINASQLSVHRGEHQRVKYEMLLIHQPVAEAYKSHITYLIEEFGHKAPIAPGSQARDATLTPPSFLPIPHHF